MKTMNELISTRDIDFSLAEKQIIRVLMMEYACQALDLASEKASIGFITDELGTAMGVKKSSILDIKYDLK